MVKTTLKQAPVITPIVPTGVDTKGPKVTPELEKTMTKTTLGSQPVIQPTAQEISATSENRANQQQQEADKLMALSSNIDRALGVDQPEQKTTDTSGTGEYKAFDPNNKTIWQGGSTFGVPGESGTTTQTGQPAPTTAEKTTVTTPEGTTTTTKETPKNTAITKDTQWQDVQNKDLNSLEQLIEARYGTVATQENGKLKANINGENFEWSLQNGQPVKTKVQDPVTSGLLNKYITASSDEILSGLINGEIPPSIETQITTNPNYAIAKEKYRKKISADITNKTMEAIYGVVTGKEMVVEDKYQSASDKIVEREKAKGKTEAEITDYASFLGNDTELVKYSEDLNAKNKQLKQLTDLAQDNAKNIMKANPGITEASALLLAARQNEPVQQQIESLSYEIANLQANINYKEKILEKDYNTQQKILEEQRQYDRQIELQKQSQLLQTGDLNSTDPYIQQRGIENAVNQLYTQYPIPGMESPAIKIQKVKDLVAQGMTPQQAIQQLEQEIRGSQRYKDYIENEKAKITPKATESWQKLSDNSLYNQTTGEVKNVGGTGMTANTTVQTDPQSIVNNAYSTLLNQGKIKEGDTTIQCGQLTNSYIQQLTGNYGTAGDTLESKNKQLEQIGVSNVPVVGGLFTLDVGTREGHIGIVQAINGNQVTVLEANREGKKEGGEPVIANYTINGKMKFSQAPQSQQQYTDSEIELLSELANMEPSARNTALKAQGIPLKAVTDYMALAKSGAVPPSESQKQAALGIISNIQGLAETDWNDAVGKYDISRVLGLQGASDSLVLIDNLRNASALNNLGMLKGPMSDKDVDFIKSVSSKLDPVQSNKQFEKNIVEMYNIAAKKAGIPTIKSLSDIPKERILPGEPSTQPTTTQGRVKNSGGRIK